VADCRYATPRPLPPGTNLSPLLHDFYRWLTVPRLGSNFSLLF
jgi:hypothetical protein